MTKWFHRCDLGWMKARQKYLTATDVKELLPFTKTGRKKTITDEHYLKVLAGKMVNLTEDDCTSTGAAARGHILEPYAIRKFNFDPPDVHLHHWDDVVVTRRFAQPFSLAFSPDALDKPSDSSLWLKDDDGSHLKVIEMDGPFGPKVLGEVKSYGPERHMVAGYTPKDELEERWQIATAMAVCTSIENAYLLFYNPSMRNQLYIVDYDRADLADEIEAVLEVEGKWLAWVANLGALDKHRLVSGGIDDEEVIIQQIIKREELNPEGEKSVIR